MNVPEHGVRSWLVAALDEKDFVSLAAYLRPEL
jgi:hypothetical protein